MYVASPPAQPPAEPTPVGRFPLPLARVITRSFDKGQAYGAGALRIIEDLAGAYGVPYAREEFAEARRTTFTDMVKALADELADAEDPIGLVVLAHGVADAEPQWPACYLNHALPEHPLAFAVADNGIVTPFLAMRITAEYIRADGHRRAAIVILDQTSFLRDPAAGAHAPQPTENRLVALVFDRDGGIGEVSVGITPDVAPEAADELLRDALGSGAVVVGGQLAAVSRASQAVAASPAAAVAAPGMPCTGPWVALLESLDRWRAGGAGHVTVVDYDRSMRMLGSCVIRLPRA